MIELYLRWVSLFINLSSFFIFIFIMFMIIPVATVAWEPVTLHWMNNNNNVLWYEIGSFRDESLPPWKLWKIDIVRRTWSYTSGLLDALMRKSATSCLFHLRPKHLLCIILRNLFGCYQFFLQLGCVKSTWFCY